MEDGVVASCGPVRVLFYVSLIWGVARRGDDGYPERAPIVGTSPLYRVGTVLLIFYVGGWIGRGTADR